MQTARQIIASELINWMQKEDIGRLCEVQRLETITRIWEFGKWCARGGSFKLGVKPQIDYSEGYPESTTWDEIPDISDDDGMRIHAATVGMDKQQTEIIRRTYINWENAEGIARKMRIGTEKLYNMRRTALGIIEDRLQKNH